MGVLHRYTGTGDRHGWEGVPTESYEGDGTVAGTRRVLIGHREGASNFSLRYFEIPPGGQSSFDQHDHDHGVYVLRGQARILMGSETVNVGPGDVFYIPPNESHQFRNTGDGPLGFLCVAPVKD